ncbi:MAG: DUF4342 domain-containing protein [Anaerovorax sp.]
MEITLEKIELVKDRTGVSYKEAKEALEMANGSVVDAIIDIEESIDFTTKGKFGEQATHIVDKIKEAVKKGNVSKIIVKKNDEVVLNLPVNIGLIGTVLAPWALIAGTVAAFGTKCVIELQKDNGEIVDISERANDTFGDVVEKGTVMAGEVKAKSAEVFSNVKEKANDAINKIKKEDEDDDDDDDDTHHEHEKDEKDEKDDAVKKCDCDCGCGEKNE